MAFSPQPYAYPLGVHLANVGYPFGQNIAGHLVSIFISKLCSLTPGPSDRGPGIRYRSSHNTTNRWRELEYVGNGGWIDKFILETPQYISY